MGIGKRIKEAREALGLTQEELGVKVGITGSSITNYEKETSHPKEHILYKLVDVLGVDPNYLFQDCVNIKKTPETDITVSEEISDKDLLTAALTNIGLIKPGYDLTAEDAKFVSGVFDILESWFAKQEKERP